MYFNLNIIKFKFKILIINIKNYKNFFINLNLIKYKARYNIDIKVIEQYNLKQLNKF